MQLRSRQEQRRYKRRNVVQSILLLGGMIALLSACGWSIAGPEGVVWAAGVGGLSLVLSPRLSPQLVLRLFRASPVSARQMPEVTAVLDRISAAAGLTAAPRLFYIPSSMMNAFTVGGHDQWAIALSDAMLRRLDLRQLAGVLAHEVSHIRNHDLWVMGLSDTITRLTRLMSMAGFLMLIFFLPSLVVEQARLPWDLLLLLIFAPTLSALLQLALARTREFDADLDAAALTGDPIGLASALEQVERYQGKLWEQLFFPGRHAPDPSILRSHPRTEERIQRLLALQVASPTPASRQRATLPDGLPAVRPRGHFPGLWY